MEILGRRGWNGDLDVVFCGELQEPLQPRARMFGAASLEAMRQEQHNSAQPAPLVFSACQELVDDHLGAIAEVAILGFPGNKALRTIQAVAILKPEHSGFR